MAKNRKATNKPGRQISTSHGTSNPDEVAPTNPISASVKNSSPKANRTSGASRRAAQQAARNRRKNARVGMVVGISIVALAGVITLAVSSGSSKAGTNTTTSAWVLPRLDQPGKVSLASLRGKPVVINMFASWCTTCRDELPAFASAARQLKGKVTFVEVNSLETGNGLGMANQFGLSQAGEIILADVGGAQASGLHDALGGGNNMPVSAFYNSSGQLLTSHVGGYNVSTLRSQLQQLYGFTTH